MANESQRREIYHCVRKNECGGIYDADTYLDGGIDGESTSGGDTLDGASSKKLADELACERATNLVLLNKRVESDVLVLLVGGVHRSIEEGLSEDDAVVLLLTELGLGPLLLTRYKEIEPKGKKRNMDERNPNIQYSKQCQRQD